MFARLGDDDVDDESSLHHVLLGFGLFLLGSSFFSIGFAFLDFFFDCFFLPISHKIWVFRGKNKCFFLSS
jgi:hypothetical protein